MTHVVTDNCKDCRFTECVATCPVDCFHADADMIYIDPDVCIDCAACVPACPVQAISSEYELPADKTHWVALNSERSKQLPVIKTTEEPLPTAAEKRKLLGLD